MNPTKKQIERAKEQIRLALVMYGAAKNCIEHVEQFPN